MSTHGRRSHCVPVPHLQAHPCTMGPSSPWPRGHSPNVICPVPSWSMAWKRLVTLSSATPRAVLRMLDRASSSMWPSGDPYICRQRLASPHNPQPCRHPAASAHGVPSARVGPSPLAGKSRGSADSQIPTGHRALSTRPALPLEGTPGSGVFPGVRDGARTLGSLPHVGTGGLLLNDTNEPPPSLAGPWTQRGVTEIEGWCV